MDEVMGELPFIICNSIRLTDVKTYMFYVICVYLRNWRTGREPRNRLTIGLQMSQFPSKQQPSLLQ